MIFGYWLVAVSAVVCCTLHMMADNFPMLVFTALVYGLFDLWWYRKGRVTQ